MAITPASLLTVMNDDLHLVDQRVQKAARVDYPGIAEILADIVMAGGKRMRPVLLLLAGRGYDYQQNLDRLITAAAGVELLHTASLVHDDTIDRAAIRRGRPTLNSVINPGAVILIGDYLFAQSAMLAAATGSPRVVSVFASTLGDICDGQLLEMTSGHRLDQSRDEYLKRIYGKTASLFAGAAEMGAVIAGAPEPEIINLRQFGSDVGTAFQILDDILDVTGGAGQLGKPAGNDLRQGTITLPVMLYLESATPLARESLERVAAGQVSDNAEIDAVIASIRNSQAIDASMQVMQDYADRARAIAGQAPDTATRNLLLEFVEQAVDRAS